MNALDISDLVAQNSNYQAPPIYFKVDTLPWTKWAADKRCELPLFSMSHTDFDASVAYV